MERFMQLSENFMDSVDLQNGIYEEKGLQMLEDWEKQADSLILGNDKNVLIQKAKDDREVLQLTVSPTQVPVPAHANQFDRLFTK